MHTTPRTWPVMLAATTCGLLGVGCSTTPGLVDPAPGKNACALVSATEVSKVVAEKVAEGGHIDGSLNQCLWPMVSSRYYRSGKPDAGVEISYRAIDDFQAVRDATFTPATSTQPAKVTGASAFVRTNGESFSLWLRKGHSVVVIEVGRPISVKDSVTDEEVIARTVVTRLP